MQSVEKSNEDEVKMPMQGQIKMEAGATKGAFSRPTESIGAAAVPTAHEAPMSVTASEAATSVPVQPRGRKRGSTSRSVTQLLIVCEQSWLCAAAVYDQVCACTDG